MPKSHSPRRYAQAIFQIATESGKLEEWSRDLETLSIIFQDPDLLEFLDSPQVPAAYKKNAVSEALHKSVNFIAAQLVLLLGSRNMVNLIPHIGKEYSRILNNHRGIKLAQVFTAIPIEKKQQLKVTRLLENVTGTEIHLESHVDPDMISGLVVRVGDKVIDGSLKTKIHNMRKKIVGII